MIDEPLCNQILNYKIKVGTKLIICDAEINNCEGCYPLEVSSILLKIRSICARFRKSGDCSVKIFLVIGFIGEVTRHLQAVAAGGSSNWWCTLLTH